MQSSPCGRHRWSPLLSRGMGQISDFHTALVRASLADAGLESLVCLARLGLEGSECVLFGECACPLGTFSSCCSQGRSSNLLCEGVLAKPCFRGVLAQRVYNKGRRVAHHNPMMQVALCEEPLVFGGRCNSIFVFSGAARPVIGGRAVSTMHGPLQHRR